MATGKTAEFYYMFSCIGYDCGACTSNINVKVYGNYNSSFHGVVSQGRIYDVSIKYHFGGLLFYANEIVAGRCRIIGICTWTGVFFMSAG